MTATREEELKLAAALRDRDAEQARLAAARDEERKLQDEEKGLKVSCLRRRCT